MGFSIDRRLLCDLGSNSRMVALAVLLAAPALLALPGPRAPRARVTSDP